MFITIPDRGDRLSLRSWVYCQDGRPRMRYRLRIAWLILVALFLIGIALMRAS